MNLLPNKKGKDFRLSFRNNYLALVAIFLLFTTSISAQTFVPYEPLFWKGFPRIIVDSSFTLPRGITARRLPSAKYDTGQIRYNLADSSVYISTGSQWRKVGPISGGGGSQDLQSVTDIDSTSSHELIIQGARLGTDGSSTFFGTDALTDNTSSLSVAVGNGALAFASGTQNIGMGVNAAQGVVGNGIVGIGRDAGINYVGFRSIFIGDNSGYNSAGYGNVGIGVDALYESSGTHVTAVGDSAGHQNTYNDVSIFGYNAFADSTRQVVLSDGVHQVRLNHAGLTGDIKAKWQDRDGTIAYLDDVTGGGTTYTASNGITLSTADFQLGGALTGTTSITGSQTLNLGTGGSKLAALNTNTSGNQAYVAAGTISHTAPLVYLFGTDSTMILNLDETTEAYPAICRSSNGRLYWKTITGGSTDTTSLSARIDLKLNKADTASLSNRINLKVNISDTASMLANYLRKIDTAVFSRKSMPAYSIRANNTSGTADATNFTFRSVGAQSISSGVPTWTAGTAPSGTENHSYTWSQIGKQVTVTFYLTYVTAGATCTAVSFPLPTDLPLPLELSGTGAADEILYIGAGYIGTAKTTVPAVSARPTIRVNSGDTGYDIYMAGTSVAARVAYGTITYTAQ